MVTKSTTTETRIEQLNRIAEDWSPEDGLPEDVSRETVEDLCQALADQGVTDVVERLSANTLLSTDEARARTLALFHDPEFTFLSQDAKALFLSTWDGKEEWITPEETDELERNAERTIQKARDTVGEIIYPERNDDLDVPKIVWLESSNVRYLRSIAADDEQSIDDVVSRLVEAELTSVPVEDIVYAYLENRDNVNQLSVKSESINRGELKFHGNLADVDGDWPDPIERADRVTIGEKEVDFYIDESTFGPHTMRQLTVYASDNIVGMDSLSVEEGLKDLRAAVDEQTMRFEDFLDKARERYELTEVAAEPTRKGVNILLMVATSPATDRFAHVDELVVGQQTSDINVQVRMDDPDDKDATSIWRHDDESGEPTSIEEGRQSLEALLTDA